MPAFTSPKYPARSLARCDWDGLCDSETSTTPTATTARTAKTHSGVRLVAQPPCRSGTNGGSVCVGEVMPWSPFRRSRYQGPFTVAANEAEFIRLRPLASSALVTAPSTWSTMRCCALRKNVCGSPSTL